MKQPQTHEYKVEPVFNHHTADAVLNSLAEEGWRLVAVTHPEKGQQFRDYPGGGQASGPWLWLERPVAQDLVSPR